MAEAMMTVPPVGDQPACWAAAADELDKAGLHPIHGVLMREAGAHLAVATGTRVPVVVRPVNGGYAAFTESFGEEFQKGKVVATPLEACAEALHALVTSQHDYAKAYPPCGRDGVRPFRYEPPEFRVEIVMGEAK